MKKAKFADKITDLVEDTLVSMGQSDPFTVYDNLDDEFSFTLEHDITHRTMNYDLREIYRTKQEEDIKVKDLYKDHVKSRVEDFVERSLEVARAERYENNHEDYDDDFEDEEDEYEDDDSRPFEDEDYDDEDYDALLDKEEEIFRSLEEEHPDYVVNTGDPFMGYAVFGNDKEQTEEKSSNIPDGIKISLAKDILPAFLRDDEKFSECVFVVFSKDIERSSYSLDPAVYEQVKDKLSGKDSYIAVLDDNHLMCVAGEKADYLRTMLIDMKDAGVNIKDPEIYYFEDGALAHVFNPDGRQMVDIDDDNYDR